MSKVLSVRMYLKHQKKHADGKVPIYVQVTIDGDEDTFSLSRKVLSDEWNQSKQKCTGKSQDALLINTKITKTRGDLTSVFDRIPVTEIVKAKQLINLYHRDDPEKEQKTRKDGNFHEKVLATIDHYLSLKNKQKKAFKKPRAVTLLEPIQLHIGETFFLSDTIIDQYKELRTIVNRDLPILQNELLDKIDSGSPSRIKVRL